MKANFLVTVTLPDRITIQEMRRYVEESVRIYAKAYSPDDPLFDLDQKKVRVQMLGVKP